jgi:serine-type D-Ala-D-Ala endopeptidase (penicillin-binding protein 7)
MRSMTRGLAALTLTVCGLITANGVFAATSTTGTSTAATKKAAAPTKATTKKKSRKGSVARTASGKPDVRSSSLLVIDEGDSSVLLSKNADVAAPIASITKLMTALVVLDAKQSLDEELTVTNEDRSLDRGTASRLAVGTTLTRGDLMHLALMSSENRAAHALGRNYPGGLDSFLQAANEKARALGMTNSYFADPTGLSSENVASPADLAKLVMAASRNPTIRSYSTDTEHEVMVGKHKVEFRTTNNLVRHKDWDIVVQKTGFTNAAGQCLVMKTVVNDHPMVIVLLNSFGKYTRVADATRIRRWIETNRGQSGVRSAMAAGSQRIAQVDARVDAETSASSD